MNRAARFDDLKPSSKTASRAARAASKKRDTKCERLLRSALWRLGARYRVDMRALAGRPDIVFLNAQVAVFCDGDFWHGRDLESRIGKLAAGHNAPYWVAKIRTNVARDRHHNSILVNQGWVVLRFWETDITRSADAIAAHVVAVVNQRKASRQR
jgi:DNA mismatch endonuclease (patch repair protein)